MLKNKILMRLMILAHNQMVRMYKRDPRNSTIRVMLHHQLVSMQSLNLLFPVEKRREFMIKIGEDKTLLPLVEGLNHTRGLNFCFEEIVQ